MSKRQQLFNLVMQAYSGLPEAHSIAAHHMNSVKEKNALKHWQIHGPGIQAAANARRQQLAMQSAPPPPTIQAAPAPPTQKLVSQLKMGQGGIRKPGQKTSRSKVKDRLTQRQFLDPISQSLSSTPYGSTLNLTA